MHTLNSLVASFCRGPRFWVCLFALPTSVLSAKSITGGCVGIDRRPCINSEGGYSAPEAIEFKIKLARFKMVVSLEPFDGFWCFNFWVKALDVYFHPGITAGPSDPYNRRSTAPAASYWQHCNLKETTFFCVGEIFCLQLSRFRPVFIYDIHERKFHWPGSRLV